MSAPEASPPARKLRRAVIVGVQRYLDPALEARPGTCAALRQAAAVLSDPDHGGWEVELLLDDEPAEERRPMLSNLLERLAWLGKAEEALLLLSGRAAQGHFLTRDARLSMLDRTAAPWAEIASKLPPETTAIIDATLDRDALPGVPWVLAASAPEAGPAAPPAPVLGRAEPNPDAKGPSRFLSAVLRALQGAAAAETELPAPAGGKATPPSGAEDVVTAAALARVVLREAPTAWHRGHRDTVLARPGMRPTRCAKCGRVITDPLAVYCPGCGSPLRAVEHLDGGRYRILRPLGAGGMGTVYLALDTRLKVERALKLLTVPPNLAPEDHEALKQRLVQECKAAQALADRSSHVVRVFDVGYSPERDEPFLVMELLEGRTLAARLAEGALELSEALAMGLTIAETLAFAHDSGIVHRDLKPDNVFLTTRGSDRGGGGEPGAPAFVKLLDFGIAKMAEAELKTQSGRMMGTLQYMPPEQLRGERVDARADVFSLGAVLFECLSGERAVPGRTQGEIFRVLLDSGVRPLESVSPHLPADVRALVDACLSLDPAGRPADGRAVAQALRALRGDRPDEPPVERTGSSGGFSARGGPTGVDAPDDLVESNLQTRRSPWVIIAVAVLLAVGGVAGALALTSGKPGRDPGAEPPALPSTAVTPAPIAETAPAPETAPGPGPEPNGPADAENGPLPTELVAEPRATVRLEGADVRYEGGVSVADRFSRLVLDLTLSDAAEPGAPDPAAIARWSKLAPAVRRDLGSLVSSIPARSMGSDGVTISRADFDASRARARVSSRTLPGVGTLLTPAGDASAPFFEKIRCGGASPGDRLVSAQWATPGYGGGRCDGLTCAEPLTRALARARGVAEVTSLRLTLDRPAAGSTAVGEADARVEVSCRVGPTSR